METGPTFSAGKLRLLFEWPGLIDGFDVTSDGNRFLALSDLPEQPPTQLNVVQNWFEELQRDAASGIH